MKIKKRSVVLIAVFAVVFAVGAALLIRFLSSQRLSVESYGVDADINSAIKICHLSDLHIPYHGVDLDRVIGECEKSAPDIIVLTGDAFDGKAGKSDLEILSDFLFELRKIAPVYAVLGNHEIGSSLLGDYKTVCAENGVDLLINKSVAADINGVRVLITGLNDGNVFSEKNLPDYYQTLQASRAEISLLLAHRPELCETYSKGNFNAVFTGHAHGGQVRIFNKGIYAPDQGLFPKYTSGEYSDTNLKMFVNRGLGDGFNSFRVFNSYNIGVVELRENCP